MPDTQTRHTAVCGMQWGDEGKGKVVDLLTEQHDMVVRFNGGANAGHSVVVGDQRYALHLVPSGILAADKINVIANGVVIDPLTLLEEMDQLRQRGVRIGANLRISNRAHVVLDYHKLTDNLMEAAIASARGQAKRIGTTGRGIGPAYADKATRSTAIRMIDLVDPDRLAERLRYVVKVKNAMLGALADMAGEAFEPLDVDRLVERYSDCGRQLSEHVCDTGHFIRQSAADGKRVLFEGANGCMLDIDHGTFPYVTSSNTGAIGIYAGAGVGGLGLNRTVGIMKAYTTRVGGGPFPTELHDDIGQRIRDRGNEYGTTTGRPRRCGWLDLVVVRYAAQINGVNELAVMLLDVLAGFDELKICTAYELNGRTLTDYPPDAAELTDVQPIYQTVPGFADEVTGCGRLADLPDAARDYLKLIERTVGVPVSIVSVGPERSQTLID